MYLDEKDLALEIVDVNTAAGQHRTPEFLARNPAGLIPVLELDDGQYLPESSAIVEYLEEKYPEKPLMGTTAEQRGRVRALERIASDLAILCAIKLRHTHPRFAEMIKQIPAAAEAVGPMLDAQLHTLEQHPARH
jgi:glutathione S-transferase